MILWTQKIQSQDLPRLIAVTILDVVATILAMALAVPFVIILLAPVFAIL